MNTNREQILSTACNLIETQGFQATGINQIIQESGTPKGSIYYYFPQGKDEIVAEAVRFAGQNMVQHIRSHLDAKEDAVETISSFLTDLAAHIQNSGFRAGGPITTVASESATNNERVNLACREVYEELHQIFRAKLRSNGIEDTRAASLAWLIISSVEGAVILSRTTQSIEPLLEASKHLTHLIRSS